MSSERNYSLSSGAATSCPKQKQRRLSGLISLKSRRSSQEFRIRGGHDQRLHGTTHDDARSTMSKAAAWVWHTRGIGEAAVLPTKRVMSRLLRHDNLQHTTNIASDHQAVPQNHSTEEAHQMNILGRRPPSPKHLPMSRFKAEAMLLSAKRQHCAPGRPPSPNIIQHERHRQARTSGSKSFFYDDLELSSLQELLSRKIDRPAVGPEYQHDAIKPLKPLSAFVHRIFKRLLNASTSVQQQQILAQVSPATSPTRYKYDPGNSAVHPVIHHHHHYYYHSLHDSPNEHAEPNHKTVLRRRRRHSESSYYQHQYSQAQDFINITTNASCEEVRNRSRAKMGLELGDVIDVTASATDIPSTEAVDDDDGKGPDQVSEILVGGLGPKLVSTDHRFHQRRHSSYCAS